MNLLARHVIFRALLRWTAAVAFCVPLKHRPHARLRALGMLLPLLGLTYVLDPAAQSTSLHELQFSLLTLYVAFFVLLGMMIYACVEIDKKSALYCAVWSLLASQTAYECWHLVEVFFEWRGTPLDLGSLPVMLVQLAAGAFFYFVICTTLSRKMSYKGVYNIGPRQLTSAFFIGILFMFQAALLSGGQVVVLDRSLVMTMFVGQFYFLTLLYFQTEVFKLSAMQKEMDTLNLLYERQREQYQVARQNVQIINKRCHELKLQIAALRQMSSAPADPELKAHIDETEKAAQLYDANNAKTYIVDAGDYYFTAATDSHNAVNNILAAKGYTVENTNGRMTEDGSTDLVWKWTNDTLDTTTFSTGANGTAITNLFDESDPNKSSNAPGSVTWMSRSDWTGTIPTAPAQLTANETLAASLAFTKYDGSEANSVEMPTLGAKNGLTLASMIGKDFDDPEWETLLDQLTYSEMVNTITLGFHNTAAAASIGKTATKDENGPQGLTAALTGGASAMCYTSEDVMAATFNVDLINEVGRCIGEDCLAMGYSGLYGPGINMHRTAYSGRNFEYYSENPFVAGTICAAEVQGIQSKGVYVYLKHVALNDSETSRRGVNTWLNEQTAREIYLEVADKAITDGGAWSVMTGFNRWGATWCGANANLLTGFLRGELGMRGMCITDFSGSSQYMDLVDGLIAGSDIWDSPMPKIHTTKAANYENDAYIVTQMRNAMHHILYTVVNSNAMNGWASTDTLKTITPWWQTAIYALIAVLAVLTILCAWQLSKALKAKKSMVDTAPAADQK